MASFLRSIVDAQALCTRTRLSFIYSSTSTSKRCFGTSKRPLSILEDDSASIDLSEDNDLVNGARPGTAPSHARSPPTTSTPHEWRAHRTAMKARFPDGWAPPRTVSREAMHGLRQLHKLEPEKFTTNVLAERFRISPEAVRRILKSKWEPSTARREKLVERERRVRKEAVRATGDKEMREVEPLLVDEAPNEEERWKGKGNSKNRGERARDRLTLV